MEQDAMKVEQHYRDQMEKQNRKFEERILQLRAGIYLQQKVLMEIAGEKGVSTSLKLAIQSINGSFSIILNEDSRLAAVR